jgi:hypothetical protein
MGRNSPAAPPPAGLARRHLRFGWWSLFAFAALGLTLEVLHGFKVSAYLDVSNETRRLMWRLAHAHGVLLAVVNVVYGLHSARPRARRPSLSLITTALIAPACCCPAVFPRGIIFYAGDLAWNRRSGGRLPAARGALSDRPRRSARPVSRVPSRNKDTTDRIGTLAIK